MALQLAGLASGFDWKTFVDSIIDLERTPANKLNSEIISNTSKSNALSSLNTKLTEMRTASTALNVDGVFDARSATVSSTSWSATAGTTAASGTYAFNITQRATQSKLTSASDIGSPIAATADVSGVTLASFGTGTALTAGDFTINGARVTVDLADSLATLFTKINTATSAVGNAVTASYVPGTDKIQLTGATSLVLGSSTDTSNFLSVSRLANNGTVTASSTDSIGAVTPTATLDNARLKTPPALTSTSSGAFVINGVSVSYNSTTDTLNSLVTRINASSAGVTAAFDPLSDKVTLQNNTTGDLGFSVSDTTGNLMEKLGLTSGTSASLSRGLNATYTVNGGATLTSMSNTLTSDSHGITGLSVTPSGTLGTETVTVAPDTSSARTKIDTFISKFNSIQSYIEEQTKITSTKGKVSLSTLSGNREVQDWGRQLRNAVFSSVPGLSSTLSTLDHLGIGFTGTEATLSVTNATTLTAALKDRPTEVSALFRQTSTGVASQLETLFTSYLGSSLGGTGTLATQTENLAKSNTALTAQIAEIDRRLVSRRQQLTDSFLAMETAQSKLKTMQSQVASLSPNNSK